MFLGWNRITEKFTCSDFRGPLFCSNLTWAGNPQNLGFSIIYCNIFYITGITLNYIFSSFKFYISVTMNLKDKTRQLTAFSSFHKPALYLWPVELSYFELLKRVPDSWLWRWSHVPSSAAREWWEGMIYRDKGSRDPKQEKETEWEWKAEWSGQTSTRNGRCVFMYVGS